jgi:hypothetical protein
VFREILVLDVDRPNLVSTTVNFIDISNTMSIIESCPAPI